MAKPLKILAFVLGGLLLLLIAALVTASLLFDPNDHRERIAAAVKEKTGRELALGAIELKLFPWLNVAIADVRLGNAAGFGETPFAQAHELSAGVRLLPLLLHRRIEVSTVTLDGLRVNLAKDAQGRSNWDDLLKSDTAAAPEKKAPSSTTEAQFDPRSIDIAGLKIRDTAIVYHDAQAGTHYELSQLNLETSALKPDAPIDIELAVSLLSRLPQAKADIRFSGTVTPDLANKSFTTRNLKLDVNGLRATLSKDKDGKPNWAGLLGKEKEKDKPDDKPFDLKRIGIASITITDAGLIYRDAKAGSEYEVSGLKLKTGAFTPGEPCALELSTQLRSKAPAAALDIGFSGTLKPDFDKNTLDTDKLKLSIKGKAKDLDVASTLQTRLVANLGGKIYNLQNLALDTTLAGAQVPGGKQTVTLRGGIAYNGAQGVLRASDMQLSAADLLLKTTLTGSGLNGENPRLQAPLAISNFSPRKLAETFGVKLNTADPQAYASASLNARYSGDFKSARFDDLVMKLDQTAIRGQFIVDDFKTQAIRFALKLDSIDADRYLAPKDKAAAKEKNKSSGSPTAALDAVKLPGEALTKLNANGSFEIGRLKVNGLSLSAIRLGLAGQAGAPKQQTLSAQLYDGSVALTHRFTPGANPAYALDAQLRSFEAAPFLKDLLGKEYVSGTADLTLDLSGRGHTVAELRRSLNGTVSALAKNGAVKGFNLGKIIRRSEAALAGNLAYQDSTAPETDFSTISVSGVITNGVLKSDDLSGASPLLRVSGSGQIDLARETINYVARPTIVETSKGQGGKELAQLDGVTVPVQLSGNLFKPKVKLKVEEAVKQKATEKIREQFKGKEDELKQKLNDKIGDLLFGKQRKPAGATPAPAPAPAPESTAPAPAPDPAPSPEAAPTEAAPAP